MYEKSPEEVVFLLFEHHITRIPRSGVVPRTECLVIDTARNEVTERRSPQSGEIARETQNSHELLYQNIQWEYSTPYMLGGTDSQQLIAHAVCRVSGLIVHGSR